MKLIGLTRVRNVEHIIVDTLNHFSRFCDGGIYVYDDVSTDATAQLCKQGKHVVDVLIGEHWDANRERAEFENRQAVLTRAQADAAPEDWFLYFDADERIEYDFKHLRVPQVDAVAMRLFDYYITPEDVDLPYSQRRWIGPEFRTIVMLYRNSPHLLFHLPDQREASLKPNARIVIDGYVRHYGKAFSVQKWEEKCQYYSEHFPKYAEKWERRKGKAVHRNYESDFGNPLILWEEKEQKGFPLVDPGSPAVQDARMEPMAGTVLEKLRGAEARESGIVQAQIDGCGNLTIWVAPAWQLLHRDVLFDFLTSIGQATLCNAVQLRSIHDNRRIATLNQAGIKDDR
ncbi:MAG: glycosyltransferase family 2 protein [bacterium]